jgi:hypothetical protein
MEETTGTGRSGPHSPGARREEIRDDDRDAGDWDARSLLTSLATVAFGLSVN